MARHAARAELIAANAFGASSARVAINRDTVGSEATAPNTPDSSRRACSDGLDEAGNRSGTWVERKQPYLQALPHKTLDALRVTAADKTHNAGCIADDVRTYGPEFWDVFNACRHQILWYYGSVLHHFEQALPASTITASLRDAVGRLANAAGSDLPSGGAALPRCGCTD